MIDAIASYSVLRLTVLLGIFLVVTLVVRVLARMIADRTVVRRRLAQAAEADLLAEIPATANLREKENSRSWLRMTEALERAGIPLTDRADETLPARLAMAGFPGPAAAPTFTIARIVLLFALPGLYLLSMAALPQWPSILVLYLVSALLALIGMYLPNLWLNLRVKGRKQEIMNGFPDCLDLMLICVEAGLGMEAAFDRVGREIVRSHPRLAELLSAATLELRAGASREQALRGMAQRAHVEEVRSFTTLLIQSDKLGTSIGSTLRVYANEMREKRRLRAEEKAHRLPVLLSIPLVTCMMPVMIGVLMLPAAIGIVKSLLPILKGGS